MTDRFQRTELLIGENAINKLKNASVLIFGLGGVGGYALESIVRSGIGAVTIVDGDDVDVTNINRQIIALDSTVGLSKTEAFKNRIREINPDCRVTAHKMFYLPENADEVDFSGYDYVIDAVDTVSAKLIIIKKAIAAGVPVISAMGTARKLDPRRIKLGDIYDTSGCPLARVMRRELRKAGIKKLNVIWSDEEPIMPEGEYDRDTPIGSVSFVPSVAGLILGGKVISDIAGVGGLYGK